MSCFRNVFRQAKNGFALYSSKVNWIVFTFIVIFTIGSWLDLNGMWCELPILVHELPEGWRLPSIIGAIIQFSQIGALSLMCYKCLFPRRVSLVAMIYTLFFIGILSLFLLIYLWDKTVKIGAERRSIGLYLLTFSLGFLDGASTVTFLPYIGNNFNKEYIIPNYVGEALSAMLPSILGIIQGVGSSTSECDGNNNVTLLVNQTLLFNQTTRIAATALKPAFSVSTFFFLMFLLLVLSSIAFTLLHYSPISKRVRTVVEVDATTLNVNNEGADKLNNHHHHHLATDYDKVSYTSLSSLMDLQKMGQVELMKSTDEPDAEPRVKISPKEKVFLLTISLLVSFLLFGFLPGVMSYATLPYGKRIFHMSINLGNLFLPFSILLSICSYDISSVQILIEFLVGILFSAYIFTMAYMSPCPLLVTHGFGAFIVVVVWITTTSIFTRVRCCIAAKLQQCGPNILFIFGTVTIIGQIFGGLLAFILVDVYRVLKDLAPCQRTVDVCFVK